MDQTPSDTTTSDVHAAKLRCDACNEALLRLWLEVGVGDEESRTLLDRAMKEATLANAKFRELLKQSHRSAA